MKTAMAGLAVPVCVGFATETTNPCDCERVDRRQEMMRKEGNTGIYFRRDNGDGLDEKKAR